MFCHQRISCHVNYLFEGKRFRDSEVCKDLAVECDVRKLLAVDEITVLEPMLTSTRVDALNPYRAHVALQNLPVRILRPHSMSMLSHAHAMFCVRDAKSLLHLLRRRKGRRTQGSIQEEAGHT